MSTHDADKTRPNPEDRRTMTRDPNSTGGPIVESGETRKGLRVTVAGSTHLTTNIDGKWYVCDTRGTPLLKTPFDTESEAVAEAQKRNNPEIVDQDDKEKQPAPGGKSVNDDKSAKAGKDKK